MKSINKNIPDHRYIIIQLLMIDEGIETSDMYYTLINNMLSHHINDIYENSNQNIDMNKVYISFLDTFLYHSSYINNNDDSGKTPLIIAIKNNDIDVAKLLLKYNANINIKDNDNKTALMYAIETNNTVLIEMLSKHK